MSESRQIEENFETLKELFVSMSQAIKQLEQQQAILEKQNKTLNETNKSFQESINRLLRINEKQRAMLGSVDQSLNKIKSLKIELDDVKKENIKLKDVFNNRLQQTQEDKRAQDAIKNYNLLLQKKIVELEKQLLNNQTECKQSFNLHVNDCYKQMSQLKVKNNILELENKSLKEQLSNLRNVHNQVISEVKISNITKTNSDDQQKENIACISPMIVDTTDENELQPLQVNIIDSDIEDNTYIDAE